MSEAAAKWVWENSRASNGSLIVLLAIANECGEGEFTEMSVAELGKKCRLSDKGVRRAVENLEALGELSVEPRPGGISRYRLSTTPVKMTGPTPVKMTGPPADPGQNDRPPTPVKMTGPPEEPQVNGTPVKMTGPEISDERSTSVVSGKRSRSSSSSEAPRDDVTRLCAHLADRIERNGAKRPTITKRWRDAARLLIDNDGRTEKQVHNMIDWCQDSEFWRSNIMSMPKLREKYDQLKLKALAELKPTAKSRQQETDDLFDAAMQRAKAREDAANDPHRDGDALPVRQGALPAAGNRHLHPRRLA